MTTTIPTTADELEQMLGNGEVANLFEGGKAKPEFGEFIRNYANALRAKDESIATQVREETQRVLADWLRDNQVDNVKRVNLNPDDTPQRKHAAAYNPKALGAKVDPLFDNASDFFAATWHKARDGRAMDPAKAIDLQSKLHRIRNDYGTAVPADGGFLVPEFLRAELLRTALETAIVRPRARVIPMAQKTLPFPALDDTSHASNVYGGVTAHWTEEGGQLTESEAKFRRIKLEAWKLTAYGEAPNELFQESIISFQALIDQIYPEAIAWFEDDAFIRGTGAGQPLGFLNSPAAVSVAKESGQTASTIVWENIVKMYARMMPTSLGRAVWVAHIDTFPELATMALSVGTGGGPVWLNNGVEGPPMTILGRPVIFTEKAETVGAAGDINFVDFGYYLIGDRQMMQAETSPHYKFQNDLTAFRFIERVDGRPWIESAITPRKGSNTLTPFVKLATRS